MNLYAVSLTADMIIEIDANSPEEAKSILAKAFAPKNTYDPLANHVFVANKEQDIHAVIKTTIIDGVEFGMEAVRIS